MRCILAIKTRLIQIGVGRCAGQEGVHPHTLQVTAAASVEHWCACISLSTVHTKHICSAERFASRFVQLALVPTRCDE